MIENDDTGYELLNENQVTYFKHCKALDTQYSKYIVQKMDDKFKLHYWITKHLSLEEKIHRQQFINSIRIPKKLSKLVKEPSKRQFPDREEYVYRNLVESIPFNQEFRDKVSESITARNDFFTEHKPEFGTMSKEDFEKIEENKGVQKRILSERQKVDQKFDYEALKQFLFGSDIGIDLDSLGSVLYDIKEHVQEKEAKKIKKESDLRILPLDYDKIDIDNLARKLEAEKAILKRGLPKDEETAQGKPKKDLMFVAKYTYENFEEYKTNISSKKMKPKRKEVKEEEEEHVEQIEMQDNKESAVDVHV